MASTSPLSARITASSRASRRSAFRAAPWPHQRCVPLGLEHAQSEMTAANPIDRRSCDVLFRIGYRLLHDRVSRPAAEAIERVALQAARATAAPGERASLEKLAAAARTALNENRPTWKPSAKP